LPGVVRRLSSEGCGRRHIRLEPEPRQVVEDASFEFGPATRAIVIFDAEQHIAAEGARDAPHPHRIHGVSQV
jgi:hypothetical protein